MRRAAMVLGIIGGVFAMLVGFFSYGWTEITRTHGDIASLIGVFDRPGLIRMASFLAPILAIAGGAMAVSRALWGGVLLLMAAGLIWYAFGFGVFTMFPISFCLTGGILAIAAGRPDEARPHF
ncbi:MAG: hypothetical protein Q4G26_13975 [Paracoccus sp. (in: a-proteobacteria)]|nr:hypothetical protein [Paracoccus sp. (in: a-proteobacteria)]